MPQRWLGLFLIAVGAFTAAGAAPVRPEAAATPADEARQEFARLQQELAKAAGAVQPPVRAPKKKKAAPMVQAAPTPTPIPPAVLRRQAAADQALLLSQAASPEAILDPQRDGDPLGVILRRVAALMDRIQKMDGAPDLTTHSRELAALRAETSRTPLTDQPARLALFTRAAALRRQVAFSNPLLKGLDRLLFVKRVPSRYEHMCDQFYGHTATPGGGLFVLERPFSDRPAARNLLEAAACENGRFKGRKLERGAFLSPDLSYDGKEILFAFTEADLQGNPYNGEAGIWTPQTAFHIFKVGADGAGLTQLTDGAWNEFDPCWLPNGRIVFISERRGGYLRCSGRRPCPLYTLHTMDAAGGDIVCISPHESNEWQPSVDHNGMVVYTRWDYVDRGANQAHHPWSITPDGRDPRALSGNYPDKVIDRPHMEMDLRVIPGSRKLVGVAAPHHGQAFGSLITIDPARPDDDKMAQLRRLTPYARFPECEVAASEHHFYGTPWPLSEEFHLCVYSPTGRGGNYGIYLVDAFGNQELLYRDPEISCLSPMPLAPRPVPPVAPHLSAMGAPQAAPAAPEKKPGDAARMAVINVYNSRYPFPSGVRIKALRIVQLLPKSNPVHHRPQIGYGCETGARAVLGTVPVESDGSAYFTLPAAREVYFQALDENGVAVQTMRSGTWAQPGETLTCNGCHDRREQAPRLGADRPLALRRAPSAIRPEPEGSNPFSFPRLVQPVLERNCVGCHAQNAAKKAPNLARGDYMMDPFNWFASYRGLMPYAFHYGSEKWELGNYDLWQTARSIPGKTGARASRLYPMLLAGHHGVKLAPEEMRRITLWLDCNSDFFGAYENTEEQARGMVVKAGLE